MLLAGLVLALSATPVRADVWTFETPSENIQCTVGQGAGVQSDITCTIIERSGSFALPRPDGCASDWGHTFTMREYGRVEVLCTPTSTSRDGHSKADYGVTGEFGGFTCESSKQGLKCTNRDGNGFFLSRKVQSVLYGAGEQGSSNGFAAASSRPDDVSVPYVMNMPYGKARSVLQEQGWWPLENLNPGNLVYFTREIFDQGYIEVDTCSPVGDTPCKFYFYNDDDQYLEVATRGENPLVAGTEILDVRAVEARRGASTPEAAAYNEPANISVACNDNGAVVSLPDRSKVYLGNQCDAYKPGVGNGGWWLAASAFIVEIDGQSTRYANDLSCDTLSYCDYRAARAQIDKAPSNAAETVAQPQANKDVGWTSTRGQDFHTAGIVNGAGDTLTLTCGVEGAGTPGSSIRLQIGDTPIKAGTLVELRFEDAYPGTVPLVLSRDNAVFVGDPSAVVSAQHFETLVETLKAGSSVTVRVRSGPAAQFSLRGSSAALGECKAVAASGVLSAAAETTPKSESEIVKESAAKRPVTVDVNAGLVPSQITPDYRFETLDGYAILPERQTDATGASLPWVPWTTVNLPIALPQMIEPDLPGRSQENNDAYAIAVAHSFLSEAERSAIEAKLGLPFPLFAEFDKLSPSILRMQGGRGGAAKFHAQRILHERDKLDEFTRGPALQEIRAALRAKIAASKLQLPLPVVRLYEVSLGEYDFESGGFPVKGIQRFTNPSASRLAEIAGDSRFNTDLMEYPKFIPMEPEAAKRLIEGIAEYRKDRYRVVNMAVFGELTDIRQLEVDKGPFTIELLHKAERIDFGFGDKVLGDVFYSIVPDKLEDTEVEAVREGGRSTPATLYGPEYLVSAVSDAFPDLLNSQDLAEPLMRSRVTLENVDMAEWGLGNLPANNILRPELAEPRRKPNSDDIRLYRAFLDGRRQAGVSKEIILPVSTWVIQAEDGTKTIEPEKPVDLIAHALEQNMSRFGNWRNRGQNHPDRLAGLLVGTPHAIEPGRIALGGGNVQVMQRGFSPVVLSLKLNKANPNAPLRFEGGLNEPASESRGRRGVMDNVPRDEGELRGHIVLELEEAPIIVEEHEGSDAVKAVVLKVVMKRVMFLDQGEERMIAFDDRQDSGSAAGDGNLPSVPKPETLPLDAETSDLLILRHLPDSVTDADFKRMLLARWEVENRNRDISSQLAWGRFFEIGQAKPEGDALDAILPTFRDWSKARAANLPQAFYLEPYLDPAAQSRIVGFGSTLTNPNNLHSVLMQCETAIRVSQMRNDYPEHKLKMLENACEYIRQASQLPSDVLYVGRAESLPAEWRGKGTSVRALAHHGTVGARVECARTIPGTRDRYCRATEKLITSGIFGETVFALDDVYLFDKVAEIQPEITARAGQTRARPRLNVQVAGVERSTQARPSPFARALMQVDDFIAGQELLERHDSLGNFAPELVETNFFDLRAVSMELVERKTGKVVANIPLVDMPSGPDASLLEPVERITVAPPSEPYGKDVVGLRLGMSFDEADRIIRDHMDVGRVLIADRKWSVRAAAGNLDPFSSGVAYESKDGREVIVIHDEPPSAEKVIVGAVRLVDIDKGTVSPAQIFSQAREKYGPADVTDQRSQAWFDMGNADSKCVASYGSHAQLLAWRDENGAATEWKSRTYRGQPAPFEAERNVLEMRSKCPSGVTLTLDANDTERDRLIFRLHDPQTLYKHLVQSEVMIQDGASFGGEAAAEGENTGIKF
ncbi:DUF6636 domain-containing protein [Nitratireductor aquibiodomus]|uniref:DUF6636 domain-containing protein n=1 Tax=Nitratireductor aquibiodomus TaxID=204799 RepID=UPI00046933A4|nr:DUF6636 domain-containing protein [Nitratireductor aquibiodomus]